MAVPEAICGNCNFFIANGVEEKQLGKLIDINRSVISGFCSVSKGPVLRERLAVQDCTTPRETFKPREKVIFEVR